MNKAQLDDTITAFVTREKRVPTPTEIYKIAGVDLPKPKIQAAILNYKKSKVKVLNVIDGRVYDTEGTLVWHQSSAGSMMPASFYADEGIGQFISH